MLENVAVGCLENVAASSLILPPDSSRSTFLQKFLRNARVAMLVSLFTLLFRSLLLGGSERFASTLLLYEGCYRSPLTDPDLPLLMWNRPDSPDRCVQECRSRYYMFAGLIDDRRCRCGSEYGKHGPSDACTVPCEMDRHNFCGATEAVSVYSTGVKGPSPPRVMRIRPVKPDEFLVTWQPPDIPNGEVLAYALRATALRTHVSTVLPTVESQVQGARSNSTSLKGLQPGTEYNVTVVALNARGESDPASLAEWTPIAAPDKPPVPRIIDTTDTTVTILLPEGTSRNGPITDYRVLVVLPGALPALTDDQASYVDYRTSVDRGLGYYVTGRFDASDYYRYRTFVVGDGSVVGGYPNVPLDTRFSPPRIGLALVSRLGRDVRFSCSDLTDLFQSPPPPPPSSSDRPTDYVALALYIAIVFLGALLVASVVLYFALRRRHGSVRANKLPEARELTVRGPICEIDNFAYVPEDVPERVDHYRRLKDKVWIVPRDCLTLDPTVLRQGRFGTVRTGVVRKDQRVIPVVVHVVMDGLLPASERRAMLRELDVCVRVSPHDCLAGFVGTCESPSALYIALELPPRALKAKLLAARSGDLFPLDRILPIGAAVARGLCHLERLGVVHALLCARSVGLASDWTPKIVGCGIGRYALEDFKYARWTAPESFDEPTQPPRQTAVVWAYGVLLWEIFAMGGTPYSDLPLDIDVRDALRKGLRLRQLLDMPDPIYRVLLSCWETDPRERPTFSELSTLETLGVCPITSITEPYVPELELNE